MFRNRTSLMSLYVLILVVFDTTQVEKYFIYSILSNWFQLFVCWLLNSNAILCSLLCMIIWLLSLSFVIVTQVSFAPARPGKYIGKLAVKASVPASSQSAHNPSSFSAEVQLTAFADVAVVRVIYVYICWCFL